jgi:small GTP-binding protein
MVIRENRLNEPYKTVMIGDSSVGKTSVVCSLFGNFKEDIYSTIGAAYSRYKDRETQTSLDIWDTAGQERFKSLIGLYFRGAKIFIYVFDLTSRKTFNNIPHWIKLVKSRRIYDDDDTLSYLIGNKYDLLEENNKNLDENEYNKFAIENDMTYLTVSAKNGLNIERLFNLIARDIDRKEIIPGRETVHSFAFDTHPQHISNSYCC